MRVLLSSVIRKLTMGMIGGVLIDILDTLSEIARAFLFSVEQQLIHRVLHCRLNGGLDDSMNRVLYDFEDCLACKRGKAW